MDAADAARLTEAEMHADLELIRRSIKK